MKNQFIRMSLCLMFLLSGMFLFAEAPDEEPEAAEEDVLIIRSDIPAPPPGGMELPLPPPGEGMEMPGTFAFIATELETNNKTVKDSPYSAQAITERIQNLADGNRIVHQNTASLYRDSQGRTRREQQLDMLGFWVSEKNPPQTIFIQDPVAGVNYILDPSEQTARKVPPRDRLKLMPPDSAGPTFEKKIPPPPGFGHKFHFTGKDSDRKAESLGKQVIEGVDAEGTLTVITIPAGEIGNELPIQIVSEKWYSQELQMYVLTKNSDPRFGETTYRLINIRREEPDAALFQVPPGYKIEK